MDPLQWMGAVRMRVQRHLFTADDPLVTKWCNAKFIQICSDDKTNSSTSWMSEKWVLFQQIKNFGWTIQCTLKIFHFSVVHLEIGLFIFYLYPQVPVRGGTRCPETTRKSEKRRRKHAAAAFSGLKALNSPGNEETSSPVRWGGAYILFL